MPRSLVPTDLIALATAPAAPYAGMTYFDTALAVVRTWDAVGAVWVSGRTPVVAQATAPADTTVLWVDTDDTGATYFIDAGLPTSVFGGIDAIDAGGI